jgi:hypothetical protein
VRKTRKESVGSNSIRAMEEFLRVCFYISCAGVLGWWGYLFIKYLNEESPGPGPGPVRGKTAWDINDCAETLKWLKQVWVTSHAKPETVMTMLLKLRTFVTTFPNSPKKTELLAQLKLLIDEITTFMGW